MRSFLEISQGKFKTPEFFNKKILPIRVAKNGINGTGIPAFLCLLLKPGINP